MRLWKIAGSTLWLKQSDKKLSNGEPFCSQNKCAFPFNHVGSQFMHTLRDDLTCSLEMECNQQFILTGYITWHAQYAVK